LGIGVAEVWGKNLQVISDAQIAKADMRTDLDHAKMA
jgi:hypothetical protein